MSFVDLVTEAGLTGRGGAGFPAATKLARARQNNATLIINACDGEIGARKDGYVMEHHFDEVFQAASHVTRGQVHVAAHRGSATADRLARRGVNVLEVPRRYVSSESTSLVSLLHGGLARPLPRIRRTVEGAITADGRQLPPTVVLNAETLWRAQQIVERGPRWFRSFGTPEQPGPRLVTLGHGVVNPGVYEAQAGMRIIDILALGGGLRGGLSAISVSGLSGGFVTTNDVNGGMRWQTSHLAYRHLPFGSGVFDGMPSDERTWPAITELVKYAAGESAGQCGPCMFGLPAVADDLALVTSGRGTRTDVERLQRRLGLLPGRGACHFPDGVSRYVRSALEVFGHLLPTPSEPQRRPRRLARLGV